MKYYFAADIGGTKTAIGLYDEAYNEIYHGKILTEPSEGCEKLLDKLYGMAGRLFEEYPVAGAGIACPGPLDVSRGVVNNTTTLGWYNVPVRRLFSEKFGVEFALLNDCNAGAYGEYVVRNCKNMAYMSISTGIGGGIALDEIAVEHLPGGAPVYRLTGAAQARLGELGAERAFLSLTHEAGMAAAVCVIE